jgi:hypothetical protein
MTVSVGANWTYLGHGEFVRVVKFAAYWVTLEVIDRDQMESEIQREMDKRSMEASGEGSRGA